MARVSKGVLASTLTPSTPSSALLLDGVARIGARLQLSPEELLIQLELLAESLPAGADVPASSLPASEEAVLREAGSLRYDMPPLADRASTRTAVRAAQLITDALSAAEAARWLAVTPGRIRQRISARTLFALPTADGWRLPRFQFTDTGVLPGLDHILAVLPADVHPLTLAGFLTGPSPDLLLGDEPVSPALWLSAGGEVAPVVELASHLHRLL